MKFLVCFLEEPSAKELLDCILPKLLPNDVYHQCIVFEGKQDLEKQIVRKLRGWNKPDSVFLVMRDQDASDCKETKAHLVDLCRQARRQNVLVRIACHELESFYFGDLNAVDKGLGQNIAGHQKKAKYRNPDCIVNPCDELKKLTGGIYQRIIGSREIAQHLSPDNNASESFNALISGIRKLLDIP